MQRLAYSAMRALVQSKQAGQEANTYIIDVRGTDETSSTGVIPTAVNIPLDQVEAALKKTAEDFQSTYGVAKPQPTNRIVTYCMRGMRAEKGAAMFTAAGYTSVDVYPGSWAEWSAESAKAGQ